MYVDFVSYNLVNSLFLVVFFKDSYSYAHIISFSIKVLLLRKKKKIAISVIQVTGNRDVGNSRGDGKRGMKYQGDQKNRINYC